MSLALLAAGAEAAERGRRDAERTRWASARDVKCEDCEVSGKSFDGTCWNCGRELP